MQVLIKERPEVFNAFINLTKAIKENDIFSPKQRELIVIAAVTTNRSAFGVTMHTERAVAAGASKDEVLQAIICCLPVVGIASVNHALEAAIKVLDKKELSFCSLKSRF